MTDQSHWTGEQCPNCGHRWGAHHRHPSAAGRGVCRYTPYAGYSCPCDVANPRHIADDQLARDAWHNFMGYT